MPNFLKECEKCPSEVDKFQPVSSKSWVLFFLILMQPYFVFLTFMDYLLEKKQDFWAQ